MKSLFPFSLMVSIWASSPAGASGLEHVKGMEACRNSGATSFTSEMAIEYRSRTGHERSESAQSYFDRPAQRSSCGGSGYRNNFVQEDKAQGLVAADLLSSAREAVQRRLDATKEDLKRKEACVQNPNGGEACSQFFKSTQEEMLQMRAALAYSKLNPQCVGSQVGRNSTTEQIAQGIAGCLSRINMGHLQPFTAINTHSFEAMTELSSDEIARISAALADELEIYRANDSASNLGNSGAFMNYFASLKNAAEIKYQSKIAANPLLRFLPGPGANPKDWQQAITRANGALTSFQEGLKGKSLREFNQYPWALEEALKDTPPQFRGDYCFVANQVIEEHALIGRGRDFILNGALFGLGFGAGGLGAKALISSGIGAGLAGGSWVQDSLGYERKMQECALKGACSAQDLAAAKSMVALDYMAIGAFGVGAAGRAASRLVAGSPKLASELATLNAADRAKAAKRIEDAAKAQCP